MTMRTFPTSLLASLMAFQASGGMRPDRGVIHAGLAEMTDSLREVADAMQGIHTVLSGFSFISQTIGFGTILLFVAVIVFSAGYAAVGVPRGKPSFFLSLVTADALWFFWKMSSNTPVSEYCSSMVKANLIVLCPLVMVAIISRAFPIMLLKIRTRVPSSLRGKRIIGADTAAALCGECQTRSAQLSRAFTEDILASGRTGAPVRISAATRESTQLLRETLEKIDRAGG